MTEQDAKLLRMAKEIHQFFSHQGDGAPEAAANHLKQFWPPTMRRRFLQLVDNDGAGIDGTIKAIAAALND